MSADDESKLDEPDEPASVDDPDTSDDELASEHSPICPHCGVSALAPEPHLGSESRCENPDCEAFGDAV